MIGAAPACHWCRRKKLASEPNLLPNCRLVPPASMRLQGVINGVSDFKLLEYVLLLYIVVYLHFLHTSTQSPISTALGPGLPSGLRQATR